MINLPPLPVLFAAGRVLATLAVLFAATGVEARPRSPKAPPAQDRLMPDAVNAASAEGRTTPSRALLVKVAVLLDRARFSPGAIDGRAGDNLDKAVRAFRKQVGLADAPTIDEPMLQKLTATDVAPALVEYALSASDLEGPFVKQIPTDLEAQSKLEALSYRDVGELLAERFHMDVALLRELNKGRDLARVGTSLIVANVSREADPSKAAAPAAGGRADKEDAAMARTRVARIVVDKAALTLSAFDRDGRLLAFYPVSVGSQEKPAPSGTLKITRIAANPNYVYNPKYAFKGVSAKTKFTVAAGPNNPVGSVWIALDQEGYGIHGTPEPLKVGKSQSHGCVRLTNWSALELSKMVDRGVPVEFGG